MADKQPEPERKLKEKDLEVVVGEALLRISALEQEFNDFKIRVGGVVGVDLRK